MVIIDDGWQCTQLDGEKGDASHGIIARISSWVGGLQAYAAILLYQKVVEPAGPNSWAVWFFTKAAEGPIRDFLVDFYSTSSDFTRRLSSVKANSKFSTPEAGPEAAKSGLQEDLGSVVAALKKRYGLKYVYCWHGLPGYWAGLSPSSPEMEKYGAAVMYAKPTAGVREVEPAMAWNPAALAGIGVLKDPTPVYNDMHQYLAASGIDGVKVDCQAGIGLMGSTLGGGPALATTFHSALEKSVATHFPNNHVINCMCHSTENLYKMSDTNIARVSDDFYPRDPASSHPHVSNCVYNSLFMSVLVLPDWDMFHSKHPAAVLHAIARAVSGGAVYVSDKPGEHNFALLRQLVLPDGSVLRAKDVGRPTRDCLFADVLRDNKS
eukprot:gene12937-5975_t